MWVGFWDFGEYWRWYEVDVDVAVFRVDMAVRPYGSGCWFRCDVLVLDGVPAVVGFSFDEAPCRLFRRTAELVDRALRECRVLWSGIGGVEVDDDQGVSTIPGTATTYEIGGCSHIAARLWKLALTYALRQAAKDPDKAQYIKDRKIDALLRLEPCVGTLEEVFGCLRDRFARAGLEVADIRLVDWEGRRVVDGAALIEVEAGGRTYRNHLNVGMDGGIYVRSLHIKG